MCLVSVCVIFAVFTDCESCTRPVSTNPGSMEASGCGRTRGTFFIAHRLEVVAVAGLLWISWCFLGERIFSRFFSRFFFFERTRPAASIRPPCLIYLSTSNNLYKYTGECFYQVTHSSGRNTFWFFGGLPAGFPRCFLHASCVLLCLPSDNVSYMFHSDITALVGSFNTAVVSLPQYLRTINR